MASPYAGLGSADWWERTRELIEEHPLDSAEILEVVLASWESIFESTIGSHQIGAHLLPKPQIMGFLLHELIPLTFAKRYPGVWRPESAADDKDLVYIPDDLYSVEIKTSSSRGSIYGNRSYAQKGADSKKSKSGYYLAVNFEKFSASKERPKITRVRFGWLDHEDWMGQAAATGQQARLSGDVESGKLLSLPL